MIIQEAISIIKSIRKEYEKKKFGVEAIDISIQSMREVEQYRAFGTVEELKEAREKQVAKKPTFVDTRFRQRGVRYGECVTLDRCYKCPSCNTHIFHDFDSEIYCKYCGQKLDWEEGAE